MPRSVASVLVGLFAVVAAGCGGSDGERAAELLAASDRVMNNAKSTTFSAYMWMEGDGMPKASVHMKGGSYANGPRAGDFFIRVTVEGVPAGAAELAVVGRNGSTFMDAGTGWTKVPGAAAPARQGRGVADPLAGSDFSRHLEKVRVDEDEVVGGQPVVKVSGVVDTAALVEETLRDVRGVAELSGAPLAELRDRLRDMYVALWISERTHVPVRGLIDFSFEGENGETAELHFAFAITGVNEPVAIPRVS